MQLLRTAAQMRRAIDQVLARSNHDRVAVVAFVGRDALSFLPNPKGVTLYCWPKAGGTHPRAIEELRSRGAIIHFVERLHMKLYSSLEGGAVIGSANLTDNALGDDGLIELGVRLEPDSIDCTAIVRDLTVVQDFDARLRLLHEEHVVFYQRNPFDRAAKEKQGRSRAPLRDFLTWFEGGRSRQPWRWGWYQEDAHPPRDAKRELLKETGKGGYRRFLGVVRRADLTPQQFTLDLLVRQGRGGKVGIGRTSWWIPETCIKTSARGWAQSPYIWFAQRTPSPALSRPFDETDRRFRKALVKAITNAGGIDVLDTEGMVPSDRFLGQIAKNFPQG